MSILCLASAIAQRSIFCMSMYVILLRSWWRSGRWNESCRYMAKYVKRGSFHFLFFSRLARASCTQLWNACSFGTASIWLGKKRLERILSSAKIWRISSGTQTLWSLDVWEFGRTLLANRVPRGCRAGILRLVLDLVACAPRSSTPFCNSETKFSNYQVISPGMKSNQGSFRLSL